MICDPIFSEPIGSEKICCPETYGFYSEDTNLEVAGSRKFVFRYLPSLICSQEKIREIDVLSRFDHPHLLWAVKLITTPDLQGLVIILPLMGLAINEAIFRSFTLLEQVTILYKIGTAISFLHDQGLSHGDIKIDNIVLQDSLTKNPFLTNFAKVKYINNLEDINKDVQDFCQLVPEEYRILGSLSQQQEKLLSILTEITKPIAKLITYPLPEELLYHPEQREGIKILATWSKELSVRDSRIDVRCLFLTVDIYNRVGLYYNQTDTHTLRRVLVASLWLAEALLFDLDSDLLGEQLDILNTLISTNYSLVEVEEVMVAVIAKLNGVLYTSTNYSDGCADAQLAGDIFYDIIMNRDSTTYLRRRTPGKLGNIVPKIHNEQTLGIPTEVQSLSIKTIIA